MDENLYLAVISVAEQHTKHDMQLQAPSAKCKSKSGVQKRHISSYNFYFGSG